jgi:hypothetical protein
MRRTLDFTSVDITGVYSTLTDQHPEFHPPYLTGLTDEDADVPDVHRGAGRRIRLLGDAEAAIVTNELD